MLVLTRKIGETIQIGEGIQLTVLRVKGNSVRIGIDAPSNVRVRRGEIPPKPERIEMTLVLADETSGVPQESWSVRSQGEIRELKASEANSSVANPVQPSERAQREIVQLADIVKRVRRTPLRTIQRVIGAE